MREDAGCVRDYTSECGARTMWQCPSHCLQEVEQLKMTSFSEKKTKRMVSPDYDTIGL